MTPATRSRRARNPIMIIGLIVAALAAGLLTAAPAQAASSIRDFETDRIGAVPAGCSTPTDRTPAAVTDRQAHGGRQSLLLADDSTTSQAVVVCPAADGDGAELKVAVRPESLQHGFLISLLGTTARRPGVEVPVFQLRVGPNGGLSWYDGLGWTPFGPTGIVPTGAWSTVIMQVPKGHQEARVYAGDRADRRSYVGAAGPVGVSPVTAVARYQFASAGTATTGDTVFVDDVAVADGTGGRPAPPHPTLRVGRPTIIDRTDEGLMQMPNTVVSVPQPGSGEEILVSYPVHGDTAHDTGTAMASSFDHGATWTNADNRNPFPDEQSFYLSRLRNGDLLAVSYHTFMIGDSGSLQAEVPTAVSTDGGHTWTHRAGRMTAPTPMKPISDATSRPGHPLGGFVLVHRVTEDADGTLFQSGYGFYAPDKKFRQILLASTDGGENWTVRGTVAADLPDRQNYECLCEAAIERTADGSMLAIMRTGSYQPLYQARSTDDGASWSTPVPLLAGPDRQPVVGVFPDLILLGNGRLVLYVGRPGQSILSSPDGNGRSWSAPAVVDYLNSGNGTQLPIGPNRVLTFGDRGAEWTPNTPLRKAVWATPVTVR